jgi:hypothetical protein
MQGRGKTVAHPGVLVVEEREAERSPMTGKKTMAEADVGVEVDFEQILASKDP